MALYSTMRGNLTGFMRPSPFQLLAPQQKLSILCCCIRSLTLVLHTNIVYQKEYLPESTLIITSGYLLTSVNAVQHVEGGYKLGTLFARGCATMCKWPAICATPATSHLLRRIVLLNHAHRNGLLASGESAASPVRKESKRDRCIVDK